MRVRFRWQWDEEAGDFAPENDAERQRSRRLLWGFLLLLVVVAGLFYWQQSRRIRQQEEAIEADVAASYRLWHNAVAAGDLELFLFQLSNQDAQWQSAQRDLFLQNRLLDRPDLGLRRVRGDGGADNVEVSLSPDWESATVTAEYTYEAIDETTEVAPLRLEQTHYYRRNGERWQLSPGGDAFWGSQERRQFGAVTVLYPQRDADEAQRIGRDLARDLRELCASIAEEGPACPSDLHITVRFERDPRLLMSLRDSFTPAFRGGDYVLPAPTLIGVAGNDASYALLYEGVTSRILHAVGQNVAPPIALPDDPLQLLCFPAEGRALRLFRFEPATGAWTAEPSQRAYRFLMAGPREDGVIVQAFTRGAEATRLRLYWWRDGQEQLIYDEEMVEQSRRPAGWSGSEPPRLLLQGFNSAEVTAQHRWLDLQDCDEEGCREEALSGYTAWSPNGRHTLVLDEQQLWRGNEFGEPQISLGVALSPFWIDDETYGYVRYDREAGAPSMQIATSRVGNDLPNIVTPVAQLSALVDEDNPPLLFISHAVINPADNDQLLLSATTVGAATSKYHIFAVRLSTAEARLLQQFERLPSGYPSLLTPAGYPPFRVSPDGRWLAATLLESTSPTTWTFRLYDLQEDKPLTVNAYYPEYPAQFPFYDWSPDGRWLAIVEDGFLRLIAPGHDYQKLVTHEMADCMFVAWVRG